MTTPLQSFVRWAETAKDNGYLPVRMEGKRPSIKNWNSRPLGNTAIRNLFRNPAYNSANLGFRTGKLVAVDIDHGNRRTVDRIRDAAFGMLGQTPFVRIGRRPRLMLFYRANDEVQSVGVGKVEILGRGKVAVVEGIHPDTDRPYDWPEEHLLDLPFSALPLVQPSDLEYFVDWATKFQDCVRKASFRKTQAGLVRAALGQLPNRTIVTEGERNNELFRRLLAIAPKTKTLQELVSEAQALNSTFMPLLRDPEVRAVTSNVWKYRRSAN